ncbi:hypothetical protein WH7805_07806 [Synechococcus sp. WH 7805]|nr:hypothetical protein WH7805_07806 [Synechococcus sp. WH 7805]
MDLVSDSVHGTGHFCQDFVT